MIKHAQAMRRGLMITILIFYYVYTLPVYASPLQDQFKHDDHRPKTTINDLDNPQQKLQALISQLGLSAASSQGLNLPNINDAKAQLGKQLFFAKILGGEFSVACASCHHPMLGGGDNLSLPVGILAVNEFEQISHDLLGLGRFNGNEVNNLPSIARNAPTIFNIGLNNRALFWDSRVEMRRDGAILTPDSRINAQGRRERDQSLLPGTSLAAAQARFPVTAIDEMRGQFLLAQNNQALRIALAARFNDSNDEVNNQWPNAFASVYGDVEVSFENIAEAIAEYERSMVFINNPWKNYLDGDHEALTEEQKAGAVLFFTAKRDGGAGCVACHQGPTFSSNRHHLTAFPQFGPGQGNDAGNSTNHDFGRENITNNEADRYHFRAPSLLNIEVTSPYGHTGAYQTLEQVVAHYNNPRASINSLFGAQNELAQWAKNPPFCQLDQIQYLMRKNNQDCQDLYPNAYANSMAVVTHLEQARAGSVSARFPLRGRAFLSKPQISRVAAFLRTLTDPCVKSRACLAPWIIDEHDLASFPDAQPLIAHDKHGNNL